MSVHQQELFLIYKSNPIGPKFHPNFSTFAGSDRLFQSAKIAPKKLKVALFGNYQQAIMQITPTLAPSFLPLFPKPPYARKQKSNQNLRYASNKANACHSNATLGREPIRTVPASTTSALWVIQRRVCRLQAIMLQFSHPWMRHVRSLEATRSHFALKCPEIRGSASMHVRSQCVGEVNACEKSMRVGSQCV